MRVGDVVVCVKGGEDHSVAEPLREGQRYRIEGVWDADLGPPKGLVPDEIRVRTSRNGFALWYPSERFNQTSDCTIIL